MSSLTIWYFLWRMSGKTIISFGKIIRLLIRSLWIYRNGGSTMCFSSLKRERWKVDNKNELENLCDNIFDAIQGTFVQKHYVTRILQSKNGNIYLLMRKKEVVLSVLKRNIFVRKYIMSLPTCFVGTALVEDLCMINFFNSKLIRHWSGYHFHFLIISRDRYANRLFPAK